MFTDYGIAIQDTGKERIRREMSICFISSPGNPVRVEQHPEPAFDPCPQQDSRVPAHEQDDAAAQHKRFHSI